LCRGSEVGGRRLTKRAPKDEQPRCAGAPDPPRGARRLDKGADRVQVQDPPIVEQAEGLIPPRLALSGVLGAEGCRAAGAPYQAEQVDPPDDAVGGLAGDDVDAEGQTTGLEVGACSKPRISLRIISNSPCGAAGLGKYDFVDAIASLIPRRSGRVRQGLCRVLTSHRARKCLDYRTPR
jgi:hypothetical protein